MTLADRSHGRIAWGLVILLSLVYLCGLFDRIVLSLVLAPLQHDLHLSDSQAGTLAGAAFGLIYAGATFPFGVAADHLSRRWLIIGALTFWSLMTLGSAVATSFALVVLFRMGVGLAEAAQVPCASSLIGDAFAPERRPAAFGVYMTTGSLGVTMAFLLGGFIMGVLRHAPPLRLAAIGVVPVWRLTLAVSGLLGMLIVPILLLALREPQRTSGRKPSLLAGPRLQDLSGFVGKNRAFTAAVVLGVPMISSGIFSLVTWMPVFYARAYGWPAPKTAAIFACTCGVSGFVGSIATGLAPGWLRRAGVRNPMPILCLTTGIWLNLLGALGVVQHSPVAATAILTLACFAQMAPTVLALGYISEVVPERIRGAFTGLFTIGSGLITNSLGPVLIGVFNDYIFHRKEAVSSSLELLFSGALLLGSALVLPCLAGLGGRRATLAAGLYS